MSYTVYKDVAGQFRWRLNAANGKIVANSGEGYWNKADCLHAINLVKASSAAPVYDAT